MSAAPTAPTDGPTLEPTTAEPTSEPTTAEPTSQPTTAEPTAEPTNTDKGEQMKIKRDQMRSFFASLPLQLHLFRRVLPYFMCFGKDIR
mmetsp:Transcript_35438/g.56811  ORF Transcript_35438/g.56811 Transcript_35438/m.56811 type:complete len:89 (-) Transcript_35438:61-327(-)